MDVFKKKMVDLIWWDTHTLASRSEQVIEIQATRASFYEKYKVFYNSPKNSTYMWYSKHHSGRFMEYMIIMQFLQGNHLSIFIWQ